MEPEPECDDPFADYPQDLVTAPSDESVELDGLLAARLKQARKQLRKIVRRLAESLNQVEAEEHQLFPQVNPEAWSGMAEAEQARAERWQRLVWRLEAEAGEAEGIAARPLATPTRRWTTGSSLCSTPNPA